MRIRPIVVWVIPAVTLVAILGLAALRAFAPPALSWRVAVIGAKLRGDLDEIPVGDLIAWLLPGSALYLADLAEKPNPHSAIRNGFTAPEDVGQGMVVYRKYCEQCHGDKGRGNFGPDLVESVAVKSDWSFFATVKWPRTSRSMPVQPLTDAEIWRVHAYLRREALASGSEAVTAGKVPVSRVLVDVTPEQIVDADKTGSQWLTYAGNYLGHRHTLLSQLTKENVQNLRLAWAAQLPPGDRELQVSPIVANGVMFVSDSLGGVTAFDARTGEAIWTFRRPIPEGLSLCCGTPNRGVAILGRRIFVATIDASLVALDASTGKAVWSTNVADYRDGYSMTGAPLALGDRVVVGVGGGEFGIRGFLAAFDAADGRQLWKFNTVPGPGEAGHETWAGDSWKTGSVPTWATGAYDPERNLIFWGTGNPGPVFQDDTRSGDNLYSNSVIAIDASSGQLRWYYQFTPGDTHDWDSAQQPILAEIEWQGTRRAVVLWANRNAFFYALDRNTGEFLFARPFAKQTWNEGFDAKGRPRMANNAKPSALGTLVWPAIMSATNWWPPSYDGSRQLVFVPSSDAAGMYFRTREVEFARGERFEGSVASSYSPNQPTTAYVKAIDAQTGDIRWAATLESGMDNFVWTVGGVLSTRTGVVFAGYRNAFRAFDADTGKELWRINLGGRVRGSPISFAMDDNQYIAVAAGSTAFAFTLPLKAGGLTVGERAAVPRAPTQRRDAPADERAGKDLRH
jgi:alcohol dehydrogenase (cytochrome c)